MATVEKLPVVPRMDYGPPEFMMIPLGELIVDKRYQRMLSDARVGRYAKRPLSGPLLGALIVSRRKSGYAVLDGQHRMALLKAKDQGLLAPCLIYDVPSSEIEAELFIDIQELRKPPTPVERHHAQLHRHDPVALAIEEICAGCGLRIAEDSRVHGVVKSVQEMRTIYQMGPELLQQTLEVIVRSWGLTDPAARTLPMIRGVSRFLRYASPTWRSKGTGGARGGKRIITPTVDIESLVSRLQKVSSDEIIRSARAMTREFRGKDVGMLTAYQIVKIYNRNLRKNLIDPSGYLLKGESW